MMARGAHAMPSSGSFPQKPSHLSPGASDVANPFGLLTTAPRDLAPVRDARRDRVRVDLDLRRLDSLGDRLDNIIDPRSA
jgi:hypothetical protein